VEKPVGKEGTPTAAADETGAGNGGGAETSRLFAILMYKKPNIYQDRLGTNMVKVETEKTFCCLRTQGVAFPPRRTTGRAWVGSRRLARSSYAID